jgi:hypothetical protein
MVKNVLNLRLWVSKYQHTLLGKTKQNKMFLKELRKLGTSGVYSTKKPVILK